MKQIEDIKFAEAMKHISEEQLIRIMNECELAAHNEIQVP